VHSKRVMSAVAFAVSNGFGNLEGSNYKHPVTRPYGDGIEASHPAFKKRNLGPASAVQTPEGPIATSTARPKSSNVAIPFARQANEPIDAGEIVFVSRESSSHGNPHGIAQGAHCNVATMHQVNSYLLGEEEDGAVTPEMRTDWNSFPSRVRKWTPDGISISDEVYTHSPNDRGYNSNYPNLVNVAVGGGPTPILRHDEGDAHLHQYSKLVNKPNYRPVRAGEGTYQRNQRQIFQKGDAVGSRLWLGLRAIRNTSNKKWVYQYETFADIRTVPGLSNGVMTGVTKAPLVAVWCLGRLVDTNLNMRFRPSGSIVVNIRGPVLRREKLYKQLTGYGREGYWVVPSSTVEATIRGASGPITFIPKLELFDTVLNDAPDDLRKLFTDEEIYDRLLEEYPAMLTEYEFSRALESGLLGRLLVKP